MLGGNPAVDGSAVRLRHAAAGAGGLRCGLRPLPPWSFRHHDRGVARVVRGSAAGLCGGSQVPGTASDRAKAGTPNVHGPALSRGPFGSRRSRSGSSSPGAGTREGLQPVGAPRRCPLPSSSRSTAGCACACPTNPFADRLVGARAARQCAGRIHSGPGRERACLCGRPRGRRDDNRGHDPRVLGSSHGNGSARS